MGYLRSRSRRRLVEGVIRFLWRLLGQRGALLFPGGAVIPQVWGGLFPAPFYLWHLRRGAETASRRGGGKPLGQPLLYAGNPG